jgi:hypothetical protein
VCRHPESTHKLSQSYRPTRHLRPSPRPVDPQGILKHRRERTEESKEGRKGGRAIKSERQRSTRGTVQLRKTGTAEEDRELQAKRKILWGK